jgi:hypothetical protein
MFMQARSLIQIITNTITCGILALFINNCLAQGFEVPGSDTSGMATTGISSPPGYQGPADVYLKKGQTCLFGWYRMGLNDNLCPDDSLIRGWTYLEASQPEKRWASIATWFAGQSLPVHTFYMDALIYPDQVKTLYSYLYIQTKYLPVGSIDSIKYWVCGESSQGPIGVRTCASTNYLKFHVIPYPINLISVSALEGSMKNILLSWEIPEIDYWDIHHFSVFRSESDTIRINNLVNCQKILDSIQVSHSSVLSSEGIRGKSCFFAIAAYDSLGEVVALSSSKRPEYSFNQFSLVYPPDGIVLETLTPEFTWEVPNSDSVQLWYGTSSDFSDCIKITGLTQEEYTPAQPLMDHSTYYWKVMTSDSVFSNETGWAFNTNVINSSPGNFSLTGPADLSVQNANPVSFSWNNASDPGDSLYYSLIASLHPSFFDTLLYIHSLTNHFYPSFVLPEDSVIYWKILAVDSRNDTTTCSSIFSFTINHPDYPSDFRLISPTYTYNDMPTQTTLHPMFIWSGSTDTDPFDNVTYTLFYATDSLFDNAVQIPGIQDTFYIPAIPLLEDSYYYWKVKATDSQNHVKWNNGLPNCFMTNYQDNPPQPFTFTLPWPNQNIPLGDYIFKYKEPVDDIYDYHRYELFYSSDSIFSTFATIFFNGSSYGSDSTNESTLNLLQSELPEGDFYFSMKCKSNQINPLYPTGCIEHNGTSYSDTLYCHIGADTVITTPGLFFNQTFTQTYTAEASVLYKLKWACNNVEYVRIEYSSNNGADWILHDDSVAANLGASDNYYFRMPLVLTNKFLFRVSSLENNRAFNINITPITVVPPTKQLSLINPNGGDSLQVSTPHIISWMSENVDSVMILLSSNGGNSWDTVAQRVPSGNNFSWSIPPVVSDSCLIKIIDAFYTNLSDVSDTLFTIYPVKKIHVSKSGNDLTGDGSQQGPYLTIQKAMLEYVNYDSIKIASGVYNESMIQSRLLLVYIMNP